MQANTQKTKFYRVRFPRFAKIHIAREPRNEHFLTLCGRQIPTNAAFAESIDFYQGDECRRCQYCTKRKRYKRYYGWVPVIRLSKRPTGGQNV
jgi:7-cyano-7-deazaguanine synthase in queuosine biosynthesis